MTERKFTDEKIALLKTEIFCHWQNDLSCYLIVLTSPFDHRVYIAEYDAFLFKVAVNLVYFVTQLLVLTVRKYGLCGSQHCGDTPKCQTEISFWFNSFLHEHMPP